MSLHGVGVDVVDQRRIERLLNACGGRFAQRWFTARERAQCDATDHPAASYAARLAAKEAVWKALGIGSDAVPWPWIEIIDSGAGTANVSLTGVVADSAVECGVGSVCVTWASGGGRATAVALAERASD